MKRAILIETVAILIVSMMTILAVWGVPACAETGRDVTASPVLEETPVPVEPDVVTLRVVCAEPSAASPLPEKMPLPAATPQRDSVYLVRVYILTDHEIRVLCRLLWSSPLRSKYWKMVLLDVVANRMISELTKENGDPLFGKTVDDVVTVGEFSYYDSSANVSKENIEIVKEWAQNAGRYVPVNGLYQDFVGSNKRELVIYDDKPSNGGQPVELRKEEDFE